MSGSPNKWTHNPPVWLVPRVIKDNATPELVTEWFAAEHKYCMQKLRWSIFFTSFILLGCIYLDVTYTPPADLLYASVGRGSVAALGLLVFAWISSGRNVKGPRFIVDKAFSAFFVLISVAYQLQYSLDYANRARYMPPLIFLMGIYALRVGPTFSGLLLSIYTSIILIFAYRAPQNFMEDVNLIVVLGLALFLIQSRIRYEAQYFVSEWKERSRLEHSERDAKLLASNAYRELIKLVYPHVVDLVQSGRRIEETMPVGHSKASVLCFDIANSSSIQHERFDDAVETFQARFYDLMCEHYDSERLVANGYRIKDVGDGVFYSVGFPFKSPHEDSASDRAVELAVRSIHIFHEEMSKLDYPLRITAGVGIAFGHVEGFFPKAGQKLYDLRGRAIVLATRYQELRKAIRNFLIKDGDVDAKKLEQTSIIVLNQSVYNNLSAPRRAEFHAFNLLDHGISVRNDPDALVAYWRAVSYGDAEQKALPSNAA